MTRITLSRFIDVVRACRKLMLAAAFLSIPGYASTASAQSSFYDAPRSLLAGKPGTLVRQEPIDGAPLGASAYRVLYRSTGMRGEPIFVSGVVVVPQGDAPVGGRPIVAWAHPTSGITSRCAPSLAIFLFQQIQGLRSFVERGYVIAATDYPGLGTPQTHPYLVGDSEARAVVDAVRVAGAMPRGQRKALCRVGPFTGRTSRAVYRHHRERLCAGVDASRRGGGGPGDRSCHFDE